MICGLGQEDTWGKQGKVYMCYFKWLLRKAGASCFRTRYEQTCIGTPSRFLAQSGFSILELMATISIASLMMAYGAANLRPLEDPMNDAVSQFQGLAKQVRARAVATMSSYRMTAISPTQVTIERGTSCTDEASFVSEPSMNWEVPNKVTVNIYCPICFNSRGLADGNHYLMFYGTADGSYKSLEVTLGGGVKVHSY